MKLSTVLGIAAATLGGAAALAYGVTAAFTIGVQNFKPAEIVAVAPTYNLSCTLNEIKSRCITHPGPMGGFVVKFQHGDRPIYDFTPVGKGTTDGQVMQDRGGRQWVMDGHATIRLRMEPIEGYTNTITITADR